MEFCNFQLVQWKWLKNQWKVNIECNLHNNFWKPCDADKYIDGLWSNRYYFYASRCFLPWQDTPTWVWVEKTSWTYLWETYRGWRYYTSCESTNNNTESKATNSTVSHDIGTLSKCVANAWIVMRWCCDIAFIEYINIWDTILHNTLSWLTLYGTESFRWSTRTRQWNTWGGFWIQDMTMETSWRIHA